MSKDDAVVVHGTPEPVALALDLEQQLVEMPFIAWLCSSPMETRDVIRAEPHAPGTDRLVRDSDVALGQQLLDISEAQVKAEIQLDGVTDDLCGEAIAAIRTRLIGWSAGRRHQAILRRPPAT
jgi:hypothetical protein